MKGFHMVATHSDSPTFKIKENPEIIVEDHYIKLNVEKYGGMILSTWLDRPLSVAGRIAVRTQEGIDTKLVFVDEDLLVIPNVAIHMNREINQGMTYRAQTDLSPLFADGMISAGKGAFLQKIASAAGVMPESILAHDLYLCVHDHGRIFGEDGAFLLSPRLDDLQSVYAQVQAFLQTPASRQYSNVCAIFDHEEVGSSSKQGADSTFLGDVLSRVTQACGLSQGAYRRLLAGSFLISADNAHAVHPNHPEKSDPTNRPYLNGGIVIKYHGAQKYTTDAYSAAYVKRLCEENRVPYQTFANHADLVGGSTLGNLLSTQVSVSAVDIGLPQLAMHSAVETAGVKDTEYAIELCKAFYRQ